MTKIAVGTTSTKSPLRYGPWKDFEGGHQSITAETREIYEYTVFIRRGS